jgi:hypothetical protein
MIGANYYFWLKIHQATLECLKLERKSVEMYNGPTYFQITFSSPQIDFDKQI